MCIAVDFLMKWCWLLAMRVKFIMYYDWFYWHFSEGVFGELWGMMFLWYSKLSFKLFPHSGTVKINYVNVWKQVLVFHFSFCNIIFNYNWETNLCIIPGSKLRSTNGKKEHQLKDYNGAWWNIPHTGPSGILTGPHCQIDTSSFQHINWTLLKRNHIHAILTEA